MSVMVLHLHALVTVGAVVDNRQRLLESRSSDPDDVRYELTDCYDHLREAVRVK